MTFKLRNKLLAVISLSIVLGIGSCKKETESRCVDWIVTDAWENVKGESLQDYNKKYGYKSGYDLPVCGIAKDTISEGKKVVLRSMNDTAFYVREYIIKDSNSK